MKTVANIIKATEPGLDFLVAWNSKNMGVPSDANLAKALDVICSFNDVPVPSSAVVVHSLSGAIVARFEA